MTPSSSSTASRGPLRRAQGHRRDQRPADRTGPSRASTRPGSTFKLVTATAALDNGLISRQHPFVDTGVFELAGCRRRSGCLRKNSGKPSTAASRCPRRSPCRATCTSTGSATASGTDGTQTGIQDTARAFGLGSATGIPLPDEQGGFIPDVETSVKQRYPNAKFGRGRERQHGHRPGLRAGHAAAAGQRLRHLRQRRHRLPAQHRAAKVLSLRRRPQQPRGRAAHRRAGRARARSSCRPTSTTRSCRVCWAWPVGHRRHRVHGLRPERLPHRRQDRYGPGRTARPTRRSSPPSAPARPALRRRRHPRGVGLRCRRGGSAGAPHLRDGVGPGPSAVTAVDSGSIDR